MGRWGLSSFESVVITVLGPLRTLVNVQEDMAEAQERRPRWPAGIEIVQGVSVVLCVVLQFEPRIETWLVELMTGQLTADS